MKKKGVTVRADSRQFDSVATSRLVQYLKTQDGKLQGLLRWCNISVLLALLVIMFSALHFYSLLKTITTWQLAIVLLIIYIWFAEFIWTQWPTGTFKPLHSAVQSREFCHFQRHKLTMLTGRLIAYSLIVLTACLLCWMEIKNGAIAVLKVTAPISNLVYLAGLYLLIRLSKKWHLLNTTIRVIDQGIINQFNQQ